jgi:hypothetical protein
MQTILTQFHLEAYNRSLSAELAHADAHQLRDIGLVRSADGSLRQAEDPSRPVGPALPARSWRAVSEALGGLYRWLRGLPVRSPDWHPHFFIRE